MGNGFSIYLLDSFFFVNKENKTINLFEINWNLSISHHLTVGKLVKIFTQSEVLTMPQPTLSFIQILYIRYVYKKSSRSGSLIPENELKYYLSIMINKTI